MGPNRLGFPSGADRVETNAAPPQPNYLVRYVARSYEKQACNPLPAFSEHGNRIDADEYVAGLIRGGHAEWGSVEIFENTHAVVQISVSYNAPPPPRAY